MTSRAKELAKVLAVHLAKVYPVFWCGYDGPSRSSTTEFSKCMVTCEDCKEAYENEKTAICGYCNGSGRIKSYEEEWQCHGCKVDWEKTQ